MPKKELLVPVGSMDCLYQAIHNGADAVYLGCKNFGARKFAPNFTNEEIITAIRLCHLYGVRIYATMNTLIKDEEVEDFLRQIEFLHTNGIDAVIVQDFGMICLIRQMYPELEIHASTQANTSSMETARLFHKLGVKRVVLSREMSLGEIEKIDEDIEKEVFVHGALCVSYSGCCLMSSMIGGRSGNRGECCGSCRLPYSLTYRNKTLVKDKYLLSTKELNTSSLFKRLLDSDITSFKIEGRMKSAEYVGFITKFYRELIDNDGVVDLDKYTNQLKTIFNREFTKGHLFLEDISNFMNTTSPNHIGLEIGKVVGYTKDKIKIKLHYPLNQQDGIRFLNSKKGFIVNYMYDEAGKMINSSNDICYVDNKVGLDSLDIVTKTQDYQLITELGKYQLKRIPVSIEAKFILGEDIEIIISDYENSVKRTGRRVEKAINSPTTKERIEEQLLKLGDSPFTCNQISSDVSDNIFVPIKEINELRREAICELISIRENKKKSIIKKEVVFSANNKTYQKSSLSATVHTEEQLKRCLKLGMERIYVVDRMLYDKYRDLPNIYYRTNKCCRNIEKVLEDKNLVSDYFDFSVATCVGDYGLNIYNAYTLYYLTKMGCLSPCVSVELDKKDINKLVQNYIKLCGVEPDIEVLCYGRVLNMIIKDNILSIKSDDYNYKLVDSRFRAFPVYFDKSNTYVFNYEDRCYTREDVIKNVSYRFDFYLEDGYQVEKIISKFLG